MSSLVVLLCGYSFSGKSTLAAALRDRCGAAVVSLDEINARRGLRGGDGLPGDEWGRTLDIAHAELEEHLERRAALVVIDDTSCYRWLRDGWRAIARRHEADVALVVLQAPDIEVETRMVEAAVALNRRGLDPRVWAAHREGFEWPGGDEEPRYFPIGGGLVDRVIAELGLA